MKYNFVWSNLVIRIADSNNNTVLYGENLKDKNPQNDLELKSTIKNAIVDPKTAVAENSISENKTNNTASEDLEKDKEERPSSPLPSGAIKYGTAVTLGAILMIGGVAFSGLSTLFTGARELPTDQFRPIIIGSDSG